MNKSTDPVAIVTGASKGIGKAIAIALSRKGYNIAIFDVLKEIGEQAAHEIAQEGQIAEFYMVDVSNEKVVTDSVKQVGQSLGTPSVLINCAGIYPRASVLEMSHELWKKVLDVNLGGVFLCSRAVAPAMLEKGEGTIINISSGRGLQGTPRGSHYAASKAGMISLTRSLALEWAPTIRVNTIIPGVTDTDQPREDTTDEELYSRGSKIPAGRIGQPEEIANAVVFMVSQEANYITGQSLCVNGGAIMQ